MNWKNPKTYKKYNNKNVKQKTYLSGLSTEKGTKFVCKNVHIIKDPTFIKLSNLCCMTR